MDPFEAYGMFLALRAHFNQKGYNYFKYNKKVKTNYDKFSLRNDKFFFHKLGKRDDPEGYLVANMVKDPKVWITSLFDQDSEDTYKEWRRRRESLTYTFENDLRKLGDNFNKALKVNSGQHPILLEKYLEGEISPETMIIINELTGVFRQWNEKIVDPFIWPETYNVLKCYRDFLDLNGKKDGFKNKIVDIFTDSV